MKLQLVMVVSCFATAPALAQAPQRPPAPPVKPVTEEYFGTKVTDNYRYMEANDDPVAVPWMKAEGRYTRALFDAAPERAALLKRVVARTGAFSTMRSFREAGGRAFWNERTPGSDNVELMVREQGGAPRKLVDLAAMRARRGGVPMAINYFNPSWDGSRIAVGISEGGSEMAQLWVYDASGRVIAGPIARSRFGPPTWSEDGKTLYISQLPEVTAATPASERMLNVATLTWDMSSAPVPVLGPTVAGSVIPLRPEQDVYVNVVPGASLVHAIAINGVQPEVELWTVPAGTPITATTKWQKLFGFDDGITVVEQRGRMLYLQSHKDAPTFQVLALAAGQPLSAARVLLPAAPGRLIERIAAASDGLYVIAREGLTSVLLRVTDDGTVTRLALPGEGSLDTDAFTDPRAPGITVLFDSWARPPRFLRFGADGVMTDRGLGAAPTDYSADRYAVRRVDATAKDGTKVPMSVVRSAAATGPRPLLINAYGSYGSTRFAYFSPRVPTLIDEGIDFAVCHVRGGGELGEAWRLGGKDATKPNSWRDLIACAETAIAEGLTTREQLFIEGGSAGGIPMGMAPAERPELFAGVIDIVPMASALRAEFQTNGPANIPEFGTVKTEAGFRNLLAMDGYQHVRDGAPYPPFLVTTGLNDPRVNSWQPGKLVARMRAANPKNVVMLRVDEEGGHGIGSTKAQGDALIADEVTFINWRLGKPGWALPY